MATAFLYRLDRNRNSNFVRAVTVDNETFKALEKNYRVTWCTDNGFDDTHYLRSRKVIEMSSAERQTLQRDHDALQRSGRMPSALSTIATSLNRRK